MVMPITMKISSPRESPTRAIAKAATGSIQKYPNGHAIGVAYYIEEGWNRLCGRDCAATSSRIGSPEVRGAAGGTGIEVNSD
jgi:hypothetical protein